MGPCQIEGSNLQQDLWFTEQETSIRVRKNNNNKEM